jgi:hypothetical protein
MEGRGTIAIETGAADAEARIEAAHFGEHQAANLETGLGARDVEESGAIGIADADIFDRRGLGGGQISRAGAGANLIAIVPHVVVRQSTSAAILYKRLKVPCLAWNQPIMLDERVVVPSSKPMVSCPDG